MKNIAIINASPKTNERSVSGMLAEMLKNQIKDPSIETRSINIRQSTAKHKTEEDFETLLKADAVVIAVPLYCYCLPGILMQFLEDFYAYFLKQGGLTKQAKIYPIVNCGFPEAGINLEAVNVLRSFAAHIGAHFRFGVLIGGGGLFNAVKDAPFMKKMVRNLEAAFNRILEDISCNGLPEVVNININANFPRKLYFFMGGMGWRSSARKNGLSKSDLYRRPYEA